MKQSNKMKLPKEKPSNNGNTLEGEKLTDPEWLALVRDAMESDVSKEQFLQFLKDKKSKM